MGKFFCKECGTELDETIKFCPNCGVNVENNNSSDSMQTSNNTLTLSRKEIMRETIKFMGANGVDGLDKTELSKKLLYFYDNNIPVSERINILVDTFNISYEDAKKIEHVQFRKVSLITDYTINKDKGVNKFDIKGNNKMLKTNVPISDFAKNIGFMIENNATPIFKMKENNSSSELVESELVNYSTVNFVDLYETRAVRHSRGGSYGKKGYRVYSGTSSSTQEWTNLGRGKFTLGSDKCYFVGGGQQRTIDRKKIIDIVYYNNTAGIEISVSNRQKSMKFLLPGRDIEDGHRLANAVKNGKTNVALKELNKDPGNCYIATFVYGSYDATEVLTLRKFRDEKLLTNYVGKTFVKLYYKTSPSLIKYFGGKIFKDTSKRILDYIITKIN